MNRTELKLIWKKEEKAAYIKGWDFSHIHGRYEEENDLPWDYEKIVKQYLTNTAKVLDYDTGGGEFLLSLNHPFARTAATEGFRMIMRHLNLEEQRNAFVDAGFHILAAEEAYRPIKFYDIGAFVWFAHIIEWEFPGFSVDKCFEQLLKMQKIIENQGKIEGTIHRYLIAARK